MDIHTALELLEVHPHEYGHEAYGEFAMQGDTEIHIKLELHPIHSSSTAHHLVTAKRDGEPVDETTRRELQIAIYRYEICLDNTIEQKLLSHDKTLEGALIKAGEFLRAEYESILETKLPEGLEIPF